MCVCVNMHTHYDHLCIILGQMSHQSLVIMINFTVVYVVSFAAVCHQLKVM